MRWVIIGLLLISITALEGVVELTDFNFKQQVKSNLVSIVFDKLGTFSITYCSHCTHLKPEITKLSHMLRTYNVNVGHVDCDTDRDQVNEDLIIDYVMDKKTQEMSYPKLIVFHKKKSKQVPLDLQTANEILDWLKTNFSLKDAQL